MSLTQQDIRKIIEAGFQPSEFRIRKEGEWRLTNQKASGPCVFLKNTKCQIYESRPTGCRIYPLVFDETLKQAVVDFLCPFGFDFFVTDADRHKLFALIKQLDNENRSDQLSDQ
jgi:Fe-S-cluster containining protein